MTPRFFYIILQLLHLFFIQSEAVDWTSEAISWLNNNSNSIFVYKIVSLAIDLPNKKKKEIVAPGIFIDSSRILTSFNPFRKFYPKHLGNITATLFVGRKANDSFNFDVKPFEIECSHQVVSLQEDDTTDGSLPSSDTKYSPLYDLMVLRVNKNISDLSNYKLYEDSICSDRAQSYIDVGGFKTNIATPGESIGDVVKWTSLYLENVSEMSIYKVNETEYKNKVSVVDCKGWVPQDWGNFICVLNVFKFSELVSGSIITSKDKLFGVGSFALFKDNKSVLVFTDVRYYNKIIMNTCAVD